MTFLSDFCEGQTEVKDVVIIPLREITAFYYKRKIENRESEPQTNADRIRAMSDEELAERIETIADCDMCPMRKNCRGSDGTSHGSCRLKWLDWLKQEAPHDQP
jgi:hypothetical protein